MVASSLVLPPDYEAAVLVMNDSLDIFTLVQDVFREKFKVPIAVAAVFASSQPQTPWMDMIAS